MGGKKLEITGSKSVNFYRGGRGVTSPGWRVWGTQENRPLVFMCFQENSLLVLPFRMLAPFVQHSFKSFSTSSNNRCRSKSFPAFLPAIRIASRICAIYISFREYSSAAKNFS